MSSDQLEFFAKVKKLAEENEELKEELEDLDEIRAQNIITDANFKFWIKLGDGKFDYGEGEIENPSFTMSCTAAIMTGIGTGEVDATSAYMAGDLVIEGNLQDAIAYGEITGVARDILEEE